MRLHVLSDLHLEFAPFDPPEVDADLVILAGDIEVGTEGVFWAESAFEVPVVYVLGNHEYYHQNVRSLWCELRHAEEACPGVTLLQNQEAEFAIGNERLRVLGATLWTDFALGHSSRSRQAMAEARDFMSDFSLIRNGGLFLTPEATTIWHRESKDWLGARLAEPYEGTTVVVTHHAPSARSLEPRHAGSLLNGAFGSDIEDVIRAGQPELWVHGHTHYNVDYWIAGTRVITNQRGYMPQERTTGFQADLVVEVGDGLCLSS